jgi:magnesium-transporting ATPase (P-type)
MALRNRGAENQAQKALRETAAANFATISGRHGRALMWVKSGGEIRVDSGTAIKSRSRSTGHAFGIHAVFQLDCMTSSERAVPDGSKLAEKDFWNHTPQEICAALGCGLEGLGSKEARQRLDQYGPNSDAATKADSLLRAVLRRLLEPLSLILLVAQKMVAICSGPPKACFTVSTPHRPPSRRSR